MATLLLTLLMVGCQPDPPSPLQPNSPPTLSLARQVAVFQGTSGQVGGPLVRAAAQFGNPLALAKDRNGTLYIVDGSRIRKISPDGNVTTLAGSSMGLRDGTGREAQLFNPWGIAVGPQGDLYLADSYNSAVRKVTPEGVVTTLAGNGTRGFLDGQGTAARFNQPSGIVVDEAGTIYVTDTENNAIRKVTSSGEVTTWVGGSKGLADGQGRNAKFNGPTGLAQASDGTFFVADSKNNSIRKVAPTGEVTTVAGDAAPGQVDGNLATARFNYPCGLALDGQGNLFVTEIANQAIRKVAPDGVVTTLAGGEGRGGFADGLGTAASFASPIGITMGASGSLFIADSMNARVRLLSPNGEVSTFAGGISGDSDGPRLGSNLGRPSAIALDAAGNLLVTLFQGSAHPLYKITQAGDTALVAGGTYGFADGVGMAARFYYPTDVVAAPDGNLFIADSANSRIRKVQPDGTVSTLAGGTGSGHVDGEGRSAKFEVPYGLTLDPDGNLYVADTIARAIRKISPSGYVTTIAGGGDPASSPFRRPARLVRDGAGNILVGDDANHQILKVSTKGEVTVLAGGTVGDKDGVGSAAQFSGISSMAIDGAGLLYVVEWGKSGVRVVTSKGEVSTLKLQDARTGAAFALTDPSGLCVDAQGQLWVAQVDGTIFVIR